MMKFKLSAEQQFKCAEAGLTRAMRYFAQFNDRYNRKEDNPGDWVRLKGDFFKFASLQMDAIAAEMVVGEALGIPYGDLSDQRNKTAADVGSNIEVKHTAWHDGHLIIAPRDRSNDIAVLVTGSCPEYRIAGWIPVAIAKQPRFKSTKDSSYWVGQLHLRPIENFRRSSYGETQVSNM
jgi:hypothetical protein